MPRRALTTSSRGRSKGYALRPPLMSNVRRLESNIQGRSWMMFSRRCMTSMGSSDSLPAFRVRDSRNLQFATRVPSAPAGQTLHEWRRERSWHLNTHEHRLCALAQRLRRATAMEGNASFLNMPPNFQARDPDFAQRFKLLAPRLQLNVRCDVTHTLPRALTFDMRGD